MPSRSERDVAVRSSASPAAVAGRSRAGSAVAGVWATGDGSSASQPGSASATRTSVEASRDTPTA